ncbi:MAG: 50S ribosomal protein L23 [Candidatus Paceibacterota bacterium]
MNKFLIKNPIISEKSTDLGAIGQYMFLVDKKATKSEIKKLIQTEHKVTVTGVKIINTKPKKRRLGRNISEKPGYKKAIVQLKKGQTLDVLPTVSQ